MDIKIINTHPATSLPSGWVWQDFSNKAGCLLGPSGDPHFVYDNSPTEIPAIKYRKGYQKVTYLFIGSAEEFKKHAESVIANELATSGSNDTKNQETIEKEN